MKRPQEIVRAYLAELDKHMEDLRSGQAVSTFRIKDLAARLHIHPRHLSNTIHDELKRSPCDLYEERILNIAKDLLLNTDLSSAQIASQLFFDPSNFTKFFKRYEGTTPKKFRDNFLGKKIAIAS